MTEKALPGSAIPSPKEIDMIKESQPVKAVSEGCRGESQPDPERIEASEIRDAMKAGKLMERQRNGHRPLLESQAAWLRAWQESHQNPNPYGQDGGRQRSSDLGVYMEGLETYGRYVLDETRPRASHAPT